ncbi:MAG: alginate export family protein [Myxococcales bacterium]|nr:alginate export family protein [Myxococcales bacterium]
MRGARARPRLSRALAPTLALLLVAGAATRSARAENASWLTLQLSHRTRFERLWQRFRPAGGDDMILALRSGARVELRLAPLVVGAELVDSRAYLGNAATPMNSTASDAFELLQAYVGADLRDVFAAGALLRLRAGRMTMDLGSRRLVARNNFRNTINSFTGVDTSWTSRGGHHARAFVVVPMRREPHDRDALVDNEVALDALSSALLWGGFYRTPWLGWGARIEGYALGFSETDGQLATRDRLLVTLGARVVRSPRRAALDLELEAMLQLGRSHETTAADDVRWLARRAFFVHAALGYTLPLAWRPRVVALFDYASGDADPDDGVQGRFDTLFGARRFDFGPTGIYGVVARSNVSSPGARVVLSPLRALRAFVGYRAYFLAQPRDAWARSGLQDVAGGSGRFIGHFIEAAARFGLLGRSLLAAQPSSAANITVEVGAAHLVRGRFALDAPDAPPGGSSTYVYTQMTLRI